MKKEKEIRKGLHMDYVTQTLMVDEFPLSELLEWAKEESLQYKEYSKGDGFPSLLAGLEMLADAKRYEE